MAPLPERNLTEGLRPIFFRKNESQQEHGQDDRLRLLINVSIVSLRDFADG